MSEQRLTRWKMTGNRFLSLFTPPARDEVDHQSAVMSPVSRCRLSSPPHLSHLLSSNLLFLLAVMVCHLTCKALFLYDLLLDRFLSLLPHSLICSFAFARRQTQN